VPRFDFPKSGLELTRHTESGKFFDVVGRRSAVFGYENRALEAWVYPLKLVDDFKLSFQLAGYPLEIEGAQIATGISVRPESTTFTYSHAGFTVRQTIFAPMDEPGLVMLLDVQSVLPLTVIGSFRPRLKLMWPAGLMTNNVGWDEKEQVYSLTEESKRFAAVIGTPGARDVSLMPYQEEPRDVPVPDAGPHQVLVRVHAASLNRGEFLLGHGLHGKPGTWKAIGGEGAGEVVAVGRDVTEWRVGDRVMGRCAGAFSEYALMEAAEAMAVPGRLSWEQAASVPLTFLVAYDMLVLQGRLKAGAWLLVTGVSSGVGVASLQLGKALGAHVIGTSGSAEKLATLAALGLDVGLRTRGPDFAESVLNATARHGADLVVNTVGGSVFAESVRAMAFEGRLATVGYVDGVVHADIDLEALHAKRLTVFGVSNKLRTKEQRAAAVPRFVADVLPHFAAGRIVPRIDRVMEFADLADAKARMESGAHVGKIVLRMPGAPQSSSHEGSERR